MAAIRLSLSSIKPYLCHWANVILKHFECESFKTCIVVNTQQIFVKVVFVVAYNIHSKVRSVTIVVDSIFAMQCAIPMTSSKCTSTLFIKYGFTFEIIFQMI